MDSLNKNIHFGSQSVDGNGFTYVMIIWIGLDELCFQNKVLCFPIEMWL